jgi:CBS domain-containing protein
MAKHKTTPRTASEIMNPRVEAFDPAMEISAAIHLLLRRGYSGAPVVDEQGGLLGELSERECVKLLCETVYEGVPTGRVADHMSKEVEIVAPTDDAFSVASRFASGRHRRTFVVQDDRLVGIITRRDLLRTLDSMRADLDRGERHDTYEMIDIRHRELEGK